MTWHDLTLFLVILAEEAGVPLPVPGDLFIAGMGVLARDRGGHMATVVATVAIATGLGSSALFALARGPGRRLLQRAGIGSGPAHSRAEDLLMRHGGAAVIVLRLVPGLRILVTVAAGTLNVRPAVFAVSATISGAIWGALYYSLGWALGSRFEDLVRRVEAHALWIAAALLVAFGVATIAVKLRRSRRIPDAHPPA
jgi:membrane protein DedA with SNARE-associated domain